jgi:hypothetical protein
MKIIKIFLDFFKGIRFIHPELEEKPSLVKKEIEGIVEKEMIKIDEKIASYDKILDDYIIAYLGKKYDTTLHMEAAYYAINRKWLDLCKQVNRKEKNINLNKNAFKNKVNNTINKLKNHEVQNK